jgi:hypothetical protein
LLVFIFNSIQFFHSHIFRSCASNHLTITLK